MRECPGKESLHSRILLKNITGSGDSWARADMEFLDSDGGLVARLENYDCVVDTSLSEAFTRNRLSV